MFLQLLSTNLSEDQVQVHRNQNKLKDKQLYIRIQKTTSDSICHWQCFQQPLQSQLTICMRHSCQQNILN